MVAGGRQCVTRSALHPLKHALQIFTDASKRRVGCSNKRAHCKGNLVPSRKQSTHELSGAKGGLSGPKRVPGLLLEQIVLLDRDNTTVVAYINKNGGMKSGLLWRILSWCSRKPVTLKARHIPSWQNDSRQTLQARPDHQDRMVPPSRGLPSNMLLVAPGSSGPVCYQVQQQTTTVCFTGYRPPCLGSGCTQPVLRGSGPIFLPLPLSPN